MKSQLRWVVFLFGFVHWWLSIKFLPRIDGSRRTEVAAACSRGLAGSVGSGQHGGRGNQSAQQKLGEG